jgi:hypothetical protein
MSTPSSKAASRRATRAPIARAGRQAELASAECLAMIGEGRPRVRPRVRFRVRPRVRLGVLRAFAPGGSSACSGAVFPADAVCEISMSVGSCVLPWYSSQRPRLSGGACLAAPVSCRWHSPIRSAAGAGLLVASAGSVTEGASVVPAGRVVASRRLLLCLARLARLGPGSARRSGSAIVSRSYTAPPSLSRRMAGRWGTGGARWPRPAIRGIGSTRSRPAETQPPSPVERSRQGGGAR